MNKTLMVPRGVPASGKSTWAKDWVADDPDTRVRVNRDDIRFMLFGKYWGVDEKYVTRVQNDLLRSALASDKSVVLDNTNLDNKFLVDVLKIASEYDEVVPMFMDFPISFEEAVQRDTARDRHVGEAVIRKFFDKHLGGIKNPTFPPIPQLPEEWTFLKYVEIEGLPRAILVDIDGTLAHHEGIRNPYDTSRYAEDLFDEVVADAVFAAARYEARHGAPAKIIVMSGRDAAYRAVLESWLTEHGFVWDDIFMRPVGDTRNDAVVKNELFERHIAGNYNVDIVFDDRDRVVQMWRQKGLRCFQVAPGAF